MTDQRSDIDAKIVQAVFPCRNIGLRATAVAGDNRRYTIQHIIVCARQPLQAITLFRGFDMSVYVNKTGCQHPTICMNNLVRFDIKRRGQRNDFAIVDCNIADEPGATGAVDDAGLLYQ